MAVKHTYNSSTLCMSSHLSSVAREHIWDPKEVPYAENSSAGKGIDAFGAPKSCL